MNSDLMVIWLSAYIGKIVRSRTAKCNDNIEWKQHTIKTGIASTKQQKTQSLSLLLAFFSLTANALVGIIKTYLHQAWSTLLAHIMWIMIVFCSITQIGSLLLLMFWSIIVSFLSLPTLLIVIVYQSEFYFKFRLVFFLPFYSSLFISIQV